MFQKIANRLQAYVLIALVTLLSAVFVLQFGGPQAEGCTAGGTAFAAKVDGETISAGEYRAVYTFLGFNRAPAEQQRREKLWEAVLDGLIERTLLAKEARDLGFEVTEDEVMLRLAEDGTMRVSLGIDAPYPGGELNVRNSISDADGNFDPERTRSFIQYSLQRSVGEFTQAQMEEELAERMRQTITTSVEVSDREVWDAYLRERDRARIKYVRFAPSFYREQLEPTAAELDAWIAEHPDEVNQEYEQNSHRYTGLEPQVRARHILVKASRDAAEDVRAEARTRAEGLLRQARGGADFATLARENSEDTGSARRGGDLGYNPRGRMVAEFDESQFSLEIGEISDLVESTFGFHIIKVEGKREGDVPEDEAKRELADRLYRDDRAKSMAQQAAEDALAILSAGTSLDDLQGWLDRGGEPEPEPEEGAEATEGDEEEEAEEEEPERNPLAPTVRESMSFGRTDNPIRGPFDSGPLVRDVFGRDMDDPRPDAPLELGNDFVIYQLTERTAATEEDYTDEVQQRLREGLLRAKRDEALRMYITALVDRAEREGRVRIKAFEIETAVVGNGTIESDPPGIDCGQDCKAAYEFATMVELTARPDSGARFSGWSGACSGSETTCIVTMSEAREVSARFRGGDPAPSESMEAMDEEPAEEADESGDDDADEE
ncbi:MAG: peptidylprolyl isomerase [Myxococcota bacterium]